MGTMHNDWVAQNHVERLAQMDLLVAQATVLGPAAIGWTVAAHTAFSTKVTAGHTKYNAWQTLKAQAAAAFADFEAWEADATVDFRAGGGVIVAFPGNTPAILTQLGLPVRDTIHTPVPVPATRPVLIIKLQKLRHIMGFADEGTPTIEAKPFGVHGIEIYSKEDGPPPIDYTQCVYRVTDTKTSHIFDYTGAMANKVVHYMARWVNTKGEPGPWSEVVSATVPA